MEKYADFGAIMENKPFVLCVTYTQTHTHTHTTLSHTHIFSSPNRRNKIHTLNYGDDFIIESYL